MFSRPYLLKLPLEIGHVIPDDDCVRLLGQFVEELDLSDLYSTYSRVKENQVSPRQMLKIVLYAYHEHNYSSRGIEKACRRDINYMYLLEGRSAPDHATIARFRSIHYAQVADKYLAMTVNYLMELGEISGEEIFIDGTKIEANANKYTFVWKTADGRLQTTFGWYSVRCLPALEEDIANARYKILKTVERVRYKIINTTEEGLEEKLFMNINNMEEFGRISGHMR